MGMTLERGSGRVQNPAPCHLHILSRSRSALSPLLLAALLLLATLLWVPAWTLTCIGESGQPVDWFIIYKLPEKCSSESGTREDLPADCMDGSDVPDGLRYRYLDDSSPNWRNGVDSINGSEGALGRSLAPLYRNTYNQVAFLLYNDQPPNTAEINVPSRGHAKGVVLLDGDAGFWLVHSVPRFPPRASTRAYSWPSNAVSNGQTLFCVSFPLDQFHGIGKQLSYVYPTVYDKQLKGMVSELVAVAEGQHVKQAPWNRSMTLTSKAGNTFRSFAKFLKFEDDLYSGLLAPALGSNLMVQFWRKGKVMPSNCSEPFHVFDVTSIKFPDGLSYKATKDHSKWAVASTEDWVCVSDLNRNSGGYLRSGGALCTRIHHVCNAFRSLVKGYEPCPHSGYLEYPEDHLKSEL